MQRRMIPIVGAICATLTLAGAPQKEASASAQLQAAINKETVEADLDGAIKQFEAIAAKYAKTNRSVAAMALVHMAACYQKKGDAQSRKILEQVVRDFGDQREAVTLARARLGGMAGNGAAAKEAVWKDLPSRFVSNVATGAPVVSYRNNLSGDLMLHNLETGETRNLTNAGPGDQARLSGSGIMSADGKLVAYTWTTLISNDGKTVAPGMHEDRREIRTIATDGTGMKVRISGKRADGYAPVALSPDNKTLLVSSDVAAAGSSSQHTILRALSLTDGTLTPFPEGFWAYDAAFSPDGKLVALQGNLSTDPNGDYLYVVNADGTGLRQLLSEFVEDMCWSPDGKSIVFTSDRSRSEGLWAIPVAGGEARLVMQEPGIDLNGFTRDGSLYYNTGDSLTDIRIAELNLATLTVTGEPKPFIHTSPGRNDHLTFSPDGNWVAWRSFRIVEGAKGTRYVLVVRASAGGDEKVVCVLNGVGAFKWFPDSKSLLIREKPGAESILKRVDVADAKVTDLDWGLFPPGLPAFTEGGRALLQVDCDQSSHCNLFHTDLQTKSKTLEVIPEMAERGMGTLSPDGKWLAIVGRSPSANVESLFVRPTASGGKTVELVRGVVRNGGSFTFAFTPDSKHLVYQIAAGASQLSQLWVIPVEGGQSRPLAITGQYPSIHPDGRLAFTQTSGEPELWKVRNLVLK